VNRHWGSTLAVALLFGATPAVAAPAPRVSATGHDIVTTKIADGIYQFTTVRDAYVRQLNSVAIETQRDVLVFDTNTRPSTARLILQEIRKLTNKPVRYVVNSHWHPDHWSGNEVYADAFPGLEIIATRKTLEFMRNVAPNWPAKFRGELAQRRASLEKEIASGKQDDGSALTTDQRGRDEADVRDYASFVDEATTLRRVYPSLTYDDELVLEHGGREIHLISTTGDAEGTTVLYLPHEKVLVTGDAISYPIPYITPPPTRQAEALVRLAELDADIIIPGHGPAFRDKSFLELERSLLVSVTRSVREALRNGAQTLDEVQKSVTADDLRLRFTHDDPDLNARYRDRVRVLVKLAVREARDGQDLP
jgi:glyoxylase-like metal-dependent hydrolase (beta-lactamase superfamily II)